MRPLIANDIESELSYAFLHAIASSAGANCKYSNRHDDNRGIDACITAWGPFEGGGYLEEVDIKIQLKATCQELVKRDGYISYFLQGLNRYNDLRKETLSVHRILVVMFLPMENADWLSISENELIMKKCAYWVSLRGAPESTNTTGTTIYLPESQIFTPENLSDICARLSRNERLNYQLP
jgi:hypothetical protein